MRARPRSRWPSARASGWWHVRRRWRRCGASLARLDFFLFDEPGDRDDLVLALDVDETHALRGASDGADVVGLHPQNHALLGDEEQFVAVLHVGDADDLAVAFARADVDDAHAAARLHAVLFDLGALPVAAFGDRQQRTSRPDDLHGDHVIVLPQRDAANAVGRAAHRPHVALREADLHADPPAAQDLPV